MKPGINQTTYDHGVNSVSNFAKVQLQHAKSMPSTSDSLAFFFINSRILQNQCFEMTVDKNNFSIKMNFLKIYSDINISNTTRNSKNWKYNFSEGNYFKKETNHF